MKHIFRTIAGKVILFIVCILSATILLSSLLGGFIMLQAGLYTRGEKSVYNDLVRYDVANLGESLLHGTLHNYVPAGLENLNYILKESGNSTPIVSSVPNYNNSLSHSWDFAIGFQYDVDEDRIYWNLFDSRTVYTGNESFNSLFLEDWGYDYWDYLADLGRGSSDLILEASEEFYSEDEYDWKSETVVITESTEGAADKTTGKAASEDSGSLASSTEETATVTSEETRDSARVEMPEETAVKEAASSEDFIPNRTTYMFFANVNTSFPGPVDSFKITYDLIHLIFGVRYYLLPIAGGSFLLGLISFILLMSVSGRRRRSEELFPGPMHRVPGDLLLFGYAIAVCILLILAEELSGYAFAIAAACWCVVLMGLLLGLCMNFAVKVKDHCFWETTLIGRFCHLIGSTFSRMKMLPRLSLVLFGILLIQFIVLIMTRSGEYLVFWILECMLLIPLFLYFASNLRDLENAGKRMASGDFSQKVNSRKLLPFLRPHADALNSLGDGMSIAVQNQLKSERMKTELITNVSHDLKTPLTSIINYANLIANEPTENEKITEYSEVLVRQSTKLKRLIEDLVEASKAATGNLEVELSPCDASVFVTQTAGEFEDRLAASDLTLVTSLPEEEVRIMADGRRMWRIFDNLMNNACKYALPGTRVYLSLEKFNQNAVIIFKNISKEPLNMSEEALMERFTRGDSSRNTEGNGLGLSIAKSMAELQNGHLHVSIDGDLFKATLLFPLIDPTVQNLQLSEQQETTDPDFDFRPLP